MLRDLIGRLDERFPALARWLGGRLDIELPAIGASVAVHLAALVALAMVGFAASSDGGPRELRGEVEAGPSDLPEFSKVEIQDLDIDDKPMTTLEAASTAPVVGPLLSAAPAAVASAAKSAEGTTASGPQNLADLRIGRAAELALPMASKLDDAVTIRGGGAEHVGDVAGAVDRVAVEIARKLEKGRTLVVWAFDASGSLQAERGRLARHIEGVYRHVVQLGSDALADDGGLLTAVVAFGQGRRALTDAPTADPAAIAAAIESVPLDDTGVESTFQTVAEVVNRWGRYKDSKRRPYQTMVIVVTDEVGDDEAYLEDAIGAARSAKVPVYVLGSPALFGRVEGYMDYTDPKTKQTFRHLPVRVGPESVALEQIRLPFWYEGTQLDTLDAGFGPYALSRLADATGGIYFITRSTDHRVTFDPDGMREYRPEWASRAQYESGVAKHPIRQAVMAAAAVTQQDLPGQPSLTFPPTDGPEFKEEMRKNQEVAARTLYTVDQALAPITAAARARDRETSRRWKAHYDLARGRLLAMKLRCSEYNSACAQMIKEPRKFAKEASNAWRLVPDEEVHLGDKARLAADEARTLLKRVVEEHPGTPWALLARRELKDPFGFQWVEARVPPRPRRDEAAAKRAMAKKDDKPAAPPPKL